MKIISHHIRRFLEDELYSYPHYVQKIAMLKSQYLEGGNREITGMPIYHSNTNTTKQKVLMMMEDREINRLSRSVERIDNALNAMDDWERAFVQEKYFKNRFTHNGMMFHLNYSKRASYFKKRDLILLQVGFYYGVTDLPAREIVVKSN